MLLMTSNYPQRRRRSGPRVLSAPRSGWSAAQSLDGRRSGGYFGHGRSRAFVLLWFPFGNSKVALQQPPPPFFP